MYGICYLLSKKYIFRLLSSTLINICAFLLSIPFTILLLTLHCVHFIFKWIILFIYDRWSDSQFSGVGRKILKGGDCGWLEKRWQEESVVQAVLVFDSKINVPKIQELITTRVIPLYPRLTHKICPLPFTAGSVHCWLPDENYDINRHVFTDHVNLSNDQLQTYVSKLVSKKLPRDKPLWELRVVSQAVDCSSTDTIVILRVHQCLADGMTLIKILCTKLTDTRASYTALKNHFKFSYYLRLIQAFCTGPALVFYRLITTCKSNNAAQQNKTEKNCTVNWSTSISMFKVERIKQVTRSSYNCVFLSAITGGLRYVLQSSGIKHPPDLKINLPFVMGKSRKFIPVSSFVPVSMEGAIPRLWQTNHQLKLLNSSQDLLVTLFVIYAVMPLCPSFCTPVLNKLLHKSANVQFSSIVGPTTRLVIDGSPLKTIYPLLPCQSDLGISIALSTYVDQVYITVMTHTSLDNIGKMLLSFIEEQLDRMYSLLINRTIPEDLGDDYFHNQLPDISGLPIKELKSRMQTIQHELQRLSEMISYNEDDVKRFSHFKSEFNHIFKEIKRRKSVKIRRPSIFTQTFENMTSICSWPKSVADILYPLKNELCRETVCTYNEAENGKCKSKLKQINFEEAMQMMFYKKCPAKPFKSFNYIDTNKYIYLTLVNENVNVDIRNSKCNRNNNNSDNNNNSSNNIYNNFYDDNMNNNTSNTHITSNVVYDTIPVDEFSTEGLRNPKLFYDLSVDEQII